MVFESADPVQSQPRDCPLVEDPEVLEGYRRDASAYVGSPEGLIRPVDASEAAWWLAEASRRGVPVTPCGLRSSTTGSGLAARGWSMSCERIQPEIEIDEERRLAVVGAGTVLRDFKDQVEERGLFYPPDPTSERECTLAGTVACDASGARSYRYGATHRWLRGVEVALVDGSVRWFRRRTVDKDAAGYAGLRDLVSVFCGSEGTLGFLTRLEVSLIDRPEAFLGALAFFTSVDAALSFVGAARHEDRTNSGVKPRCLELLDERCLAIMRDQNSGVVLPAGANACVFFEEEHSAGAEGEVVERWWSLLERSSGALADDTVVATDRIRQEELRMLRHAVPASLNEEGSSYMADGGKKISTDWAVPFDQLASFMKRADGWLQRAGIERVARFGHVGNGHPHYNLMLRDAEEVLQAEQVVARMCEEACGLGGTITAEHGVGKVKRPYLRHRFGDLELASMRAIKELMDPSQLLAPENLFP
jgi:glycolate oxidase